MDDQSFATFGLRLLSGRGFHDRDVKNALRICIVNEAFARPLTGRGNAVGQM